MRITDSGSAAWLCSSTHIDARARDSKAQPHVASKRHGSSNAWPHARTLGIRIWIAALRAVMVRDR